MISIERSKKGFFCRVKGVNGEILMNGEILTRRANAVKQLIRLAQQFGSQVLNFVDNTGKTPVYKQIDLY